MRFNVDDRVIVQDLKEMDMDYILPRWVSISDRHGRIEHVNTYLDSYFVLLDGDTMPYLLPECVLEFECDVDECTINYKGRKYVLNGHDEIDSLVFDVLKVYMEYTNIQQTKKDDENHCKDKHNFDVLVLENGVLKETSICDLKDMQECVDGYIERVYHEHLQSDGIMMYVDAEGKLKRKKESLICVGDNGNIQRLCGNVLFVGCNGEDTVGLTNAQKEIIKSAIISAVPTSVLYYRKE